MKLKKLQNLLKKHNQWRSECINLIASENVMSPLAEKFYLSDLMHRYAEGLPFKRYYQGNIFFDQIEALAQEEFKKFFKVNFCDLRPISGTIANYAIFCALGKRGDKIITCGLFGGSHISHEKDGAAGILGFQVHHFRFDEKTYTLDVEDAKKKIKKIKPRFIVLGASVILFPHPIKELKKTCEKYGVKIIFDAAHVFGLIAGEEFQDPIAEGADVITSSTHKTFPGPQGGIILGNVKKELQKEIQKKVFPGFLSNHHLHRIPPLLITLWEMEKYGKSYAKQIVKNAKALAETLFEEGFEVLAKENGFTKSHQVLLDVSMHGGGKKVAETLERANIILNKNIIIKDKNLDPKNPSGLRLGVQEMTRFGMKEKEMKIIAKFIKRVILDKEKPEKVKKDVIEFRRNFQKVKYTFKS